MSKSCPRTDCANCVNGECLALAKKPKSFDTCSFYITDDVALAKMRAARERLASLPQGQQEYIRMKYYNGVKK